MAEVTPTDEHPSPIGTATIDERGVIILDLYRDAEGNRAVSQLVYWPEDRNYPAVHEHVSPIRPGETKLIYPFE